MDFNPRAPQGARPPAACRIDSLRHFNPRAPQGARRRRSLSRQMRSEFQSTRSAGSATLNTKAQIRSIRISIHALRRERDSPRRRRRGRRRYFNPRAPQGARPLSPPQEVIVKAFQSTRSAGSATSPSNIISVLFRFQSTRSAGSATHTARHWHRRQSISIHALRRERDF